MKAKDVKILCIGCCKQLQPYPETSDGTPQSSCWDDANVDGFMAGYGSRHDLERFIFGICDDCVDKFLATGQLIRDMAQEEEDWRLRHEETKRIVAENPELFKRKV
ncbi:MAG: hypothetical protein M0R80_02650 [Proteobacteria bacterium]|nr:hypothetical protein [Pseudomonadota bacterium]